MNVLKLLGAGSADAAPVDADADFNRTVLLIHGNGTNGGQNNTFLDSSANNWTITRNGNPTQGSFSPFNLPDGYLSNYFDGTDDYLSVADNANLRPGAGAFTLEAWIYRAASGAAHTVYAKGGTSTGIVLQVTSGNVLRFTHTTTNIDSTGTVPDNTWVHVAVVREGTSTNQTKLYINGVQDGQGTVSTDFTQTEQVRIGTNRGAAEDFAGYISNVRFVKGSALYTAGFTPSAAPLTTTSQGASSSEVELLTCQSNKFVDNSTNAFAITSNNNVLTTTFSPFAPSAAYDSTVNGGSGEFDGNGDYLSIADDASLRFGTGNFTIQCWVYRVRVGANDSIIAKGSSTAGWALQITGGDVLRFVYGGSTISSTGTIPSGVWTHVAVVREGTGTNQLKLYINGIQDGQATVSTNFNQTNAINIGASRTSIDLIKGYIADLKYVVGTAETITVPTSPLTGGDILLKFSNASIFDHRYLSNFETVGNAQIDTTTKKFGTGSLEFDGTGDWLLIADNVDHYLNSGNFTIELQVYLASADTGSARGLIGKGTATTGWLVALDSSQKVQFFYGSSTITSSGSITLDAWNHIAVVREGTSSNQTKIYINGTNDGTGTVNTVFNQTNPIYIGANRAGNNPMKGFIDEVRVTRTNRYSANFTPPTSEFFDK